MINNSLHQRMTEPLLNRAFAPFILLRRGFVLLLQGFRKLYETLGRIWPSIEQHVFHQFEQVFGNFGIDSQHPRVHDSHVEAGLDRMIQEGGVHRFADEIVTTK